MLTHGVLFLLLLNEPEDKADNLFRLRARSGLASVLGTAAIDFNAVI